MKPSRHISPWHWLLISIGCVLILVFLLTVIGKIHISGDSVIDGKKVAIVKVAGSIFNSEKVIKELDDIKERKDVVAVVLRVNSPGGGIAPSQEIYQKVKDLNETKPVVTSMGDVAASGGYYIALGSHTIVANPGTVTGSIGVIVNYPVVTELMEKVGVDVETIKSGDLKDAGSPTREVTDEDLSYFNDVVMNLHHQFVRVVAISRRLDKEVVEELADGRVYTGEQSLELGLIDTLGTFDDAIRLAGELGGIEGKPKTVEPKRRKPSLIDWLFGDKIQEVRNQFSIPRFEYRWR